MFHFTLPKSLIDRFVFLMSSLAFLFISKFRFLGILFLPSPPWSFEFLDYHKKTCCYCLFSSFFIFFPKISLLFILSLFLHMCVPTQSMWHIVWVYLYVLVYANILVYVFDILGLYLSVCMCYFSMFISVLSLFK